MISSTGRECERPLAAAGVRRLPRRRISHHRSESQPARSDHRRTAGVDVAAPMATAATVSCPAASRRGGQMIRRTRQRMPKSSGSRGRLQGGRLMFKTQLRPRFSSPPRRGRDPGDPQSGPSGALDNGPRAIRSGSRQRRSAGRGGAPALPAGWPAVHDGRHAALCGAWALLSLASHKRRPERGGRDHLEPGEGGTWVRIRWTGSGRRFPLRFLLPLMRGSVTRQAEADLRKLKDLVEKRPPEA